MTPKQRDARRALVAAGARLHERHTCGRWAPLPEGGCTGHGCPVCDCDCDQIPDGPEPDTYSERLF